MMLRLLLDENVPVELGTELTRRGHEVMLLPSELRAADDRAVLEFAVRETFILVTLDTDFGTLIFAERRPAPSAVVLIRLRAGQLVLNVQNVATAVEMSAGESGSFIVIDSDEVRTRRMPY